MTRTYTIGSDSSNDIALADPSVSRRHAALTVYDDGRLEVVDQGSRNGTHLVRRGGRVTATRPAIIERSDAVAFGDLVVTRDVLLQIARDADAPGRGRGSRAPRDAGRPDPGPGREPVRQEAPRREAPMPPQPVAADVRIATPFGTTSHVLRLAEFIPVVGAFSRLTERGLLVPSIGFTVLLAYLWSARDTPIRFVQALGVFTVMGALFFVYRLCGRRKPLFSLLGVMAAEWFVLQALFFTVLEPIFRPAFVMTLVKADSVPEQFVGHFFAAGLMEECAKMLPVVGLIWLTRRYAGSGSARWGVTEPLDAVLFACASAAVFVMDETLTQYVPGAMRRATEHSGNAALGLYAGLSLGIVRTLDSLTGHLAFSGYFGYFVGLALLRPKQAVPLVLGGYVVASTIHALGNALGGHQLASLVVSATAFVFLLAVILNARKLSPSRHENFATMYHPTVRGGGT